MGKTKSKVRGSAGSTGVAVAITDADIMEACRAGDLKKLRRWGCQGISVTTAEPLCSAAGFGHPDILRCLVVDLHADVNRANAGGATPLNVAALMGRTDILRCFVNEFGADVNKAKLNGATPSCMAAQNGHLENLPCLVTELGADINKGDEDGVTPISIAALMNHLDIVRYLVQESGVDVNQENFEGDASVLFAIHEGQLDIVWCLVDELDADINRTSFEGCTPLMVAAKVNNQTIIKHLVHKGARVRAISRTGTAITLLECAGATAANIAYLEVRECCANPGCDDGGRKRCAVCKETRYCGKACQVMHWPLHRVSCRRAPRGQ